MDSITSKIELNSFNVRNLFFGMEKGDSVRIKCSHEDQKKIRNLAFPFNKSGYHIRFHKDGLASSDYLTIQCISKPSEEKINWLKEKFRVL